MDSFLEKTRVERERRLSEKKTHDAALRIQKWMRMSTARRKELTHMRRSIDGFLGDENTATLSGLELYHVGQKLLFVYNPRKDNERFKLFCTRLLSSMERSAAKAWYVSVSVDKAHAISWIKQVKKVLVLACNCLRGVKPGLPKDDAFLSVYLNVIVLFTDYTLWKFSAKGGAALKPTLNRLCSTFISHLCDADFYAVMHELLLNGLGCAKPKLSKHVLPAAMGIRALALQRFSPEMMSLFTQFVLTAPASLLHLHQLSPETMRQLEKAGFACRLISSVTLESLAKLDSNSSLCVFANLVHLSVLNLNTLTDKGQLNCLLNLLTRLMNQCLSGRSVLKSSTAHWHPFFGWCKDSSDNRVSHAAVHIRTQLQYLWSGALVAYLYSPVLAVESRPGKGKAKFSLFKKSSSLANIDDAVILQACSVCSLYDCCRQSLPQIGMDILIGLGCNSTLVKKLWYFVRSVIGLDVSRIAVILTDKSDLAKVLSMTCQVTQYLLAILDDEELLVQQKHFTADELTDMASFLNRLVFKLIWDELDAHDVLSASHELLILLYNRDTRRSFMGSDMWVLRSLKFSAFLSEFKSAKPRAVELMARIPHVVPHKKRVEMFYQLVNEEKSRLGVTQSRAHQSPATYISIHRNCILEDGFVQLSRLPSRTLKGTVKVKFINEQGLDEAGIDETGVFKEYLEETMKKAFNPSLNLFKVNSIGHIYPSPTSHVHENHLFLFEFIGKMLGKAVFEGIVVEAPFAPFFLSQMLEHHRSALYSCFDELPSMDPELYKSLCYIKHCEEEVEDLCLTFSWDEDFLGKTVSHELIPGGCVTPVTNQNRISYVHRMATFRMRTQIKQQASAFIKGFHAVIDKSWVACFSPHELQKLISGDEVELDVNDLRGHTQYYGGFHDNHKVVLWLWDVIKNEFTADEKSAFLKFVTSCSKSPLLGFSTLEPPFSIRCVQVSEEQDSGDSVGSVLRGFFSVRQRGVKDRLPTASTCFNLLKLPNYTKKSILRDKLRYAISANAGFELS